MPPSPPPRDTVDLRSDTVTQPSPEMRTAMASAAVGDDVYGEDPTVNRLQEVTAELLGTEAALFVPTGSMANQVAIWAHTSPGDELLVGANAHSWLFESGAVPVISSVTPTILPGDGRFTADDVRKAYKADNHLWQPTRLVSIENTHNMGGGLVWSRAAIDGVLKAARELELGTHLDGARIWNAAVASGESEAELAAGFDTISVCLSKGLGAPVGSVLAGKRELVHRAHRARKMLGGGMRQAGILAAAGLFAIEKNRERLREDHKNAAYLAQEINQLPGLNVDTARVETNIVMIDVDESQTAAPILAERARSQGVLFSALGERRIRLVTHLDAGRAACTRVLETLGKLACETA